MTRVRPGQLYRRADDPEQRWVLIKVHSIVGDRAHVTDADGRWPRTVRLAALHASAATATGRKRRSGYILVADAPEGEA